MIERYRREKLPLELGLHTLRRENPTVTAETVRATLDGLREFEMRVWIDHGAVITNLMRRGWDRRNAMYYVAETLSSNGFDRFSVMETFFPTPKSIVTSA